MVEFDYLDCKRCSCRWCNDGPNDLVGCTVAICQDMVFHCDFGWKKWWRGSGCSIGRREKVGER